METLGTWLRQAREAAGSTLRDVEEATHIRLRFLEMLEAGEFTAFPGGEVQVRGFLRIYARYLGLAPDEVVARYDAEIRSGRVAPAAAPAAAPTIPPAAFQFPPAPVARPRWTGAEILMVAALGLIAVLLAVATAVYITSRGAGEGATAAAATATPTVTTLTPAGTPTVPTVMPTLPADTKGGVTLALEATEYVWICVTVDGTAEFEGMLAPGQTESWSGREMVIVDTGNGAGLLVTVNGQLQGTMCGRGEVCSRAWSPGGEIAVPSPVSTP